MEIAAFTLRSMYAMMVRLRLVEERIADLLLAGEIQCPTHLYTGQEAIATGVCANLHGDDYVFTAHRSHGHYLAKGGDLKLMMAELYGKQTGCCQGRGGSMHLVARHVGILGTTPILAAGIPLAVGTGLASSLKGDGRMTVVFFGDGATEEGTFHESLNFASLKKLPVVFVCENNFYSTHLPLHDRQPADNIHDAAVAHAMAGGCYDGNDIYEVYRSAGEAVGRARGGLGPTLLEYKTYRWRGHVGPNYDLDCGIRSKEELERWMERCPVKRLAEKLRSSGLWSESEERDLIKQIETEVEEAIAFARESPLPDEKELSNYVFKSDSRGFRS